MKYKMILLLLTLQMGGMLSLRAQEKKTPPPNIIVFLVDDMGWQDTSVPFWDSLTAANKKFQTPNMERLAARSMKFTEAYANSICTPTRVSLMTGMNAAHHKVTNWTMYKNKAVDPKDGVLKEPDWNVNGLSPIKGIPRTVYATSLFEVLKEHGYFTIHCGKAHFGAYQTPGANPENLGAEVNIAGSAAGNPASYLGTKNYGHVQGKFRLRAINGLKEYWGTETFLTKALTLEAIKAMNTAQEKHKPFFLYMAHYAVHLPYNPDPRYYDYYLKQGLNESEAAYAALIEGMDASLGVLMDYLDKNRLTKNTVIIFMSDNGGLSHPPRTGEMDTQNYPLRYGKGSLYEGGIREPMLVSWPGVTPPGSVTDQYVAVWDFFPTILQIAGITHYETVQKIDGKSFVPVLKNPSYTDMARTLVWHFPDNWGGDQGVPGYSWTSAIRKGNWKLIYLQKQGELRLYNLQRDIGEQHNLASRYPEKTAQLAHLLTQKLKQADAQMPVIKATGERVQWPADIAK